MKHNPYLTKRMHNILVLLRDSEDGELVHSGSEWWIDLKRVGRVSCGHLIALCLVRREETGSQERYEIFSITAEGEKIIDDPELVPRQLR